MLKFSMRHMQLAAITLFLIIIASPSAHAIINENVDDCSRNVGTFTYRDLIEKEVLTFSEAKIKFGDAIDRTIYRECRLQLANEQEEVNFRQYGGFQKKIIGAKESRYYSPNKVKGDVIEYSFYSPTDKMLSKTYTLRSTLAPFERIDESEIEYYSSRWKTTYKQASITICDRPDGFCKKTMIGVDNDPSRSNTPLRSRLFIGTYPMNIYKMPDLQEVLETVVVSTPQISSGSWRNGWGRTPKGFLTGPAMLVPMEIVIDTSFKSNTVTRVVAFNRFLNTSDNYEPIIGYIQAKDVMDWTSYQNQKNPIKEPSFEGLTKRSHPFVKALPTVSSPYLADDPMADIRKKLPSNSNNPLSKYGFLQVLTSKGGCSGTLVEDRNTVVTAPHCFTDVDTEVTIVYNGPNNLRIKRVAKVPPNDYSTFHGTKSVPLQREIAMKYGLVLEARRTSYAITDSVILKLDEPFPQIVLPVKLADIGYEFNPKKNTDLSYLVGFPGDIGEEYNVISPCPPPHQADLVGSWRKGNFFILAQLKECISTSGNSGGALISIRNNTPRFIGSLSGGAGAGLSENSCYKNTYDNESPFEYLVRRYPLNQYEGFSNVCENNLFLCDLVKNVANRARNLPDKYRDSLGCPQKPYDAPFFSNDSSTIVINSYLNQQISSANVVTPLTGLTNYQGSRKVVLNLHESMVNWYLLKDFQDNGCIKFNSKASSFFVEGRTLPLHRDKSDCVPLDVKLPLDFKSTEWGLMLSNGSLVFYDLQSREILRTIHNVFSRCSVDEYLCRGDIGF
jgi:hypothetical protein